MDVRDAGAANLSRGPPLRYTSAMRGEPPSAGTDVQWDRAEFAEPTALACAACSTAIADTYFEVNGTVVCDSCQERIVVARARGSAPARLLAAAVLGIAAAAVGAIVWYAVREVTHLEIGLIAIAVGLLVGTAVRRGARGRGGAIYQVLAVVLTYLAIVSANAPYVWRGIQRRIAVDVAQHMSGASPTEPAPSPDAPAVQARVNQVIAQFPLAVWARIGWMVLESPFLGGVQNAIGWIIIFFGLQQAWRLARATPFAVTGPFSLAERATPA
jgi:hypothetical protein